MGDTAQSRMHASRPAYDPHCLQRHMFQELSSEPSSATMNGFVARLVDLENIPILCVFGASCAQHNSSHAYISDLCFILPSPIRRRKMSSTELLLWASSCSRRPDGIQSDIRIHDIEMILFCWGVSYLLLISCHGRHSTRAVTLPTASYDPSLPATTFCFMQSLF